jgi:hypothetical protein
MRTLFGVATEANLETLGFHAFRVGAKTLNIDHDDAGRGPFCRLAVVEDTAPGAPGVYGWTRDGDVMYVGRRRCFGRSCTEPA